MKKFFALIFTLMMLFSFCSTALAATSWITNGTVIKGGESKSVSTQLDAYSSKLSVVIQETGWTPSVSAGPAQLRGRKSSNSSVYVTHIMSFTYAGSLSSAYLEITPFNIWGSITSTNSSQSASFKGYANS